MPGFCTILFHSYLSGGTPGWKTGHRVVHSPYLKRATFRRRRDTGVWPHTPYVSPERGYPPAAVHLSWRQNSTPVLLNSRVRRGNDAVTAPGPMGRRLPRPWIPAFAGMTWAQLIGRRAAGKTPPCCCTLSPIAEVGGRHVRPADNERPSARRHRQPLVPRGRRGRRRQDRRDGTARRPGSRADHRRRRTLRRSGLHRGAQPRRRHGPGRPRWPRAAYGRA